MRHTRLQQVLSKATSWIDWRAFWIAVAVSLLSLAYPLLTFDVINKKVIACKVLQFLGSYLAAYGIDSFFRKKRDDDSFDFALKAFALFFAISMTLFLVLYPGGWRWDDLNMFLGMESGADWPTWQHYLTTLFYMLCYITLPIPAFVVFVQVTVICAISAYIAYRVSAISPLNGKAILIIGSAVLLLPPMINMDYYPLRPTLHAYLEMLVLFMLVDRFVNKRPWSVPAVLFIACVGAIVCALRTECLVLIPILPFLFFFLAPSREERVKRTALFLSVLVLMAGALNWYQMKTISEEYSLTAYMPSLIEYAHHAKTNGDQQLLEELSVAYDVDVLDRARQEGLSGEGLYWQSNADADWQFRIVHEEMSQDEYHRLCRDVFLSATLQHPMLFLASKIGLIDSGIRTVYTPAHTSTLYSIESPAYDSFLNGNLLNYPLFPEMRTAVASFVEAQGSDFAWVAVFYDIRLLIPVYVAAIIYLLIRRSRACVIPLTLVVQAIIVALAAPAYYFMYYFAFYLGGILLGVWLLCIFAFWLRGKAERDDGGDAEPAFS